MANVCDINPQDWQAVLTRLDKNQDGKIDYSEFVQAAINKSLEDNHANLQILFDVFDKDGNGVIDMSELKSTFNDMDNKR